MPIYKKSEDGMYYKNNYSEICWESVDELIDRATPMTPIMSDSGFHTCKCSARVKENDNYCWQCGKALDWSDNK